MVQWLADAYSRLPKACIGSSCARCYKASVVLRLNAVFFFLLLFCFILLLFVYFVKFQHFSHRFVSGSFFLSTLNFLRTVLNLRLKNDVKFTVLNFST